MPRPNWLGGSLKTARHKNFCHVHVLSDLIAEGKSKAYCLGLPNSSIDICPSAAGTMTPQSSNAQLEHTRRGWTHRSFQGLIGSSLTRPSRPFTRPSARACKETAHPLALIYQTCNAAPRLSNDVISNLSELFLSIVSISSATCYVSPSLIRTRLKFQALGGSA